MQKRPRRFRVPRERRHRFFVLRVGCLRVPDPRKMPLEHRQTSLPDFRAERGCAPVRAERKEEVISAFHHRGHDRPRQRIIGIHKRVVRREAVKLKNKLHHFKACVTHQGMAETEPAVAYFRRNGLVRPQGQESALSLPLFNHTQGEAWRIGRDELTHERSVDGQCGQQGE